MSTHDFMIGDYMIDEVNGNILIITNLDKKKIICNKKYNSIQPFLLNSYILDINDFWETFEEKWECFETDLIIMGKENNYTLCHNSGKPILDFKYVHELQHIINIFGIKKQIIIK